MPAEARQVPLRFRHRERAGRQRDAGKRIAREFDGDFRLTPNQNLIVANVAPEKRARIDELARQHGLDRWRTATPLRLDALACVALPTCPLAMAEAERYLPWLLDAVHARLARHGLERDPLTLRITGCPNGCARPYLAEIGLVGKAPGRYNLLLGGDAAGKRLNVLFLENADEATILDALDAQFAAYARLREPAERFGDFLWRAGVLDARNGVHGRRASEAA